MRCVIRLQRINQPYTRTFTATATRAQATVTIAPALGALPQPGDLYAVGLLSQSIAPGAH